MAEIIRLDGQNFVGADLRGKAVSYAGGEPPDLLGANLDQAQWHFEGAAGNTLAMLAILDVIEPGFAARAVENIKKQIAYRYTTPRH